MKAVIQLIDENTNKEVAKFEVSPVLGYSMSSGLANAEIAERFEEHYDGGLPSIPYSSVKELLKEEYARNVYLKLDTPYPVEIQGHWPAKHMHDDGTIGEGSDYENE